MGFRWGLGGLKVGLRWDDDGDFKLGRRDTLYLYSLLMGSRVAFDGVARV